MKVTKLIISVFILAANMSIAAYATEVSEAVRKQIAESVSEVGADCTKAGEIAGSVMRARQDQVPLDDVIKAMFDSVDKDLPYDTHRRIEAMIVNAFMIERFANEDLQSMAVILYKNRIRDKCMEEFVKRFKANMKQASEEKLRKQNKQ